MDERLREIFLRELMILQSPQILSADFAPCSPPQQQYQIPSPSSQVSFRPNSDKKNNLIQLVVDQKEANVTDCGNKGDCVNETNVLLENQTRTNSDNNNKSINSENISKRGEQEVKGTSEQDNRRVNITLFDDSGSTGRTLSASFIACDTNLTHALLTGLKTPIGIQSRVLLRLNDVIAITYS